MTKLVTQSRILKKSDSLGGVGVHDLKITGPADNVVYDCPMLNKAGRSSTYDIVPELMAAMAALGRRGVRCDQPTEILVRTRRAVQFMTITLED